MLLSILLACTPEPVIPPATIAYIVRHAEKDTGEDPHLSEEGALRAQNLAVILRDVELAAVFATEYNRTIETVEPTASEHSLVVDTSLDPRADLAEFILANHKNQAVLSAGHSNTVPELLEALGAEEPPAIDDDDYGQLWVAILSEDGALTIEERSF